MAPTITHTADLPQDFLHLSHKIRKPLVEKMRRDRINNCIEELKALLGPQMLNQQPDSKMEKADILEMTVCLLRQTLEPKTFNSQNTNQGISSCFPDVVVNFQEVPPKFHCTTLKNLKAERGGTEENTERFVLSPLTELDHQSLWKKNHFSQITPWRPW